jgi:23S rRNA (cytosine1962-C5)-methyltransferase
LFCYHGGFALHLAAAGAHVTAVDSSREALERAHRDAVDGGLAERIELRAADAFEVLSGLSREKPAPTFDLIVVDPPAFAPNRRTVASGLRGYKDLNLRALRLLPPGGVLITCSCSAHVTAADFAEVVAAAAADAGRAVQVLERRGADVDHPALLGAAETHYLKCLILRAF